MDTFFAMDTQRAAIQTQVAKVELEKLLSTLK